MEDRKRERLVNDLIIAVSLKIRYTVAYENIGSVALIDGASSRHITSLFDLIEEQEDIIAHIKSLLILE